MTHALSSDAASLLDRAIADLGTLDAVAKRIRYARSSLSLARNGKYPGDVTRIERAIRTAFGESGQVDCPHLRRSLAEADCQANRLRPLPTSDPEQARFWQACRFCRVNPDADDPSLTQQRPLSHNRGRKDLRHAKRLHPRNAYFDRATANRNAITTRSNRSRHQHDASGLGV